MKDLPLLVASPHVRRLVATALVLASRYPRRRNRRALRLEGWAHQLGYGGHWLTKSRRWSTTFTALRTAWKQHQAAQRPGPADQASEDDEIRGAWQMVDVGYRLAVDGAIARGIRSNDRVAREEFREQQAQRRLMEALAA